MVVQRMNRPASRAVAIGVAAAMACATLVAVPHMAQAQPEAQTNAKKDVQVIAFQQTWNTVAKECTSTYGPEGVAYVEVSPPQESIRHAMVDVLPAGKLQARFQARHGSRIQKHDQAVQCRRR